MSRARKVRLIVTCPRSGPAERLAWCLLSRCPSRCPGCWRLLPKCPMRALRVVLDLPFFDRLPHLLQRCEPVLIQALVPEPAVERLGEGIVGWLAGAGKLQLHP